MLRRAKVGYKWDNKGFESPCDNLILFAKNKNQIDSLLGTVHLLSVDIGVKSGIKKCGLLIMERGKVIRTKGIRLPDG